MITNVRQMAAECPRKKKAMSTSHTGAAWVSSYSIGIL
jgi:hypothetical protein